MRATRKGLALTVIGLLAATLSGCSDQSGDTDSAPPTAHPAESVTSATADTTPATSVVTSVAADPPAPDTSAAETTTTTVRSAPPSTLDGPRTTAEASEEDPVPVGEVVELPGLWDLSVTEVDLDAADEVLAYADINPAPEEGQSYVLVTIEGVYLGDRIAQPAFEWAVSDGVTEYVPSIPGCGVIPDSIYDVVEVTPGAKFHANLCVPVDDSSIARGLTLFLQPLGDEARYFELG